MPAVFEVHEEVIPLLEVRTYAYDTLRRMFLHEPSRESLALLCQEGFPETFPFQEESELIRDGVREVLAYRAEHDLTCESVYDRLLWDYTRMFVGPNKLPAPPWESVYVHKERLLFQEVTLQVRQSYLAYGLLPAAYGHEADDHVGLELDFMYQLTRLSSASNSKGNLQNLLRDQKSFLEGHLLPWIPAFSQSVVESAQTGFYQGTAKLLHGFLLVDLKAIAELLAE